MSKLLDSKLINKLREIVTNEDLFWKDPVQKGNWNLICATMDRLDSSVLYINDHVEYSEKENDIILFIVHCSIIKDVIYQVSHTLGIDCSNKENIFYKYAKDYNLIQNEEDYNNYGDRKNHADDKFYEYLRSLIFAHPIETSFAIPSRLPGEIQYSPYILSDRFDFHNDYINTIGVMIYSNKREMFHICIKFDDLKEYIRLKFEKINAIINAFQEIINNKEKEWSSRKVNRNQDNDAILLEVIDILNERYLDDSDIKKLYDYLTCSISNESNIEIVNEFRKKIIKAIPIICDCIDNMNYEELYQITNHLLNPYIREVYPMMHYQLEKIYSYLNDDGYGDIYWGLTQADLFSKEFAKDWVNINIVGMSFIEIKLLVTIACYYQAQKEVK